MNAKRMFYYLAALLIIVSIVLTACGPTGLAGSAGGNKKTATEPPATQPPATEPPATEPPATEPPATQPPAVPPTDEPKNEPKNQKITICHATGSATNPYVEITVSVNAADGTYIEMNGTDHTHHTGDLIPAPAGGCPQGATETPKQKDNQKITICHATGSATNPYVEITVSVNAANGTYIEMNGTDHTHHTGDIIPAPAGGCPKGPTETPKQKDKITICHATGSATNPYVEITVSVNAANGTYIEMNGTDHTHHTGDIIPAPAGGCPNGPTKTPKPPEKKITLCHATGSATNPYVEITVSINAVSGQHGHEGHVNDIIPAPAGGCPVPPTKTPSLTSTPGGPTETITNTPTITATPAITIVPPPTPDPATCPDFIIFHTFREGNLQVYRLDGVEGQPDAQLYNLTRSDAVDCRPSRSPNDAWVVFQSDRNGNVELYYTDVTGESQTRLTNTSSNNINPMFGPDNTTVAYQSDRNGNWDLFTIDSNTDQEQQLTSDSHNDVNPYWSPDMRWMTFQTDRNGNWDIYLLDTQTGNEYSLVSSSANEIYPTWSPSGQQIAYLTDASGVWNLHVININGTGDMQITNGDGDTGNVTWSPEGSRLAYQIDRGGNLDVYAFDLKSNSEYRLTDYAGADSSPTWNCGGSLISFTTSRSGNPDIFQVPWQGGTQSALTNNLATDKWSEWSPAKETGSHGE